MLTSLIMVYSCTQSRPVHILCLETVQTCFIKLQSVDSGGVIIRVGNGLSTSLVPSNLSKPGPIYHVVPHRGIMPNGYSLELNGSFAGQPYFREWKCSSYQFFNVNSIYSREICWLINWVIEHLSVLSHFSGSFRDPCQCHQWSQWSMVQSGWLITSTLKIPRHRASSHPPFWINAFRLKRKTLKVVNSTKNHAQFYS